MALFISLIRFTQDGIKNIRESPRRAATFKTEAKKLGVKVLQQYWTVGQYDGVLVVDAPDAETMTAAMLTLGAHAAVHTETLAAFDGKAMEDILSKLPAAK
jgi:uncharacterized protein with GYD domain